MTTSRKRWPTIGYRPEKIDRHEIFKEVPDECLWSPHRTVVADVLVADQLNVFIVFYFSAARTASISSCPRQYGV